MRSVLSLAVLTASAMAVLAGRPALAQYPPVRDRDYAVDLHDGTALGSVRIVGMGGAAVALAEGSVGMLSNPASPAMRPATSRHTWDWDWHLDWLNPGLGSDFDNSGLAVNDELQIAPLVTAGLVGQYKTWALGLSLVSSQRRLPVPDGLVEPSFLIARLTLARSYPRFTFGVGVRGGSFTMRHVPVDAQGMQGMSTTLFELGGSALDAGIIWHPADRDIRVGVAAALPVTGRKITTQDCDPLNCQGFILPTEVRVPWNVSLGAAWRKAGTRWNTRVEGPFRDERYVLLAADVLVNGPSENGHSVSGFIAKVLQPSGRTMSISLRMGAEYEWLPGRLRIRAGSYWEPGRITDRSGRLHVTAGLDVRFWSFCLWSEPYRARLSLTADWAERYGNTGLSIGLWH